MARRWGRDDTCESVTLNTNMASNLDANGGNCWLKNSTVKVSGKGSCGDCISAVKIA